MVNKSEVTNVTGLLIVSVNLVFDGKYNVYKKNTICGSSDNMFQKLINNS